MEMTTDEAADVTIARTITRSVDPMLAGRQNVPQETVPYPDPTGRGGTIATDITVAAGCDLTLDADERKTLIRSLITTRMLTQRMANSKGDPVEHRRCTRLLLRLGVPADYFYED